MITSPENEINLWVISYLFSPVWAGPAERFLRYGSGLRARGIKTTIVTAMRPNQARSETKNGVRIERIGDSRKNVAHINSFFVGVLLRALISRSRPDVVLLLSATPYLPPLLLLLKLARIRSIYVSTMARLDSDNPVSVQKWILNKLKFLAYNGFDCLVCSTESLVRDLTILGIKAEKVNAIPNGVSLSRFRPARGTSEINSIKKSLGLPAKEPIVLYIGLMLDRKGVIQLVEAWKKYRNQGGEGWLIMVGQELRDDPEFKTFYDRWDRCLSQINCTDQIDIRGPQAHVEEYYRAADLFVFLSDLEGTPNVLPEAMATGLPVLTTKFKGFSGELGRDGNELVFTDREPSKVCSALFKLLYNAALRHSLASNARCWVEKYQDVDRSMDQYATLIRGLSKKKAREMGV